MKSLLVFIGCSIIIASCNKDKGISVPEYIQKVENENSGLKIKKEMGEVVYFLQYKPLPYIVIKEEKSLLIDTALMERRMQKLNDLQYYNLRIQSKDKSKDILSVNISSEQDYTRRQNYFSFEFENDIRLIEGKDTLSPALYQFVGNYGISPYVDCIFGFKKDSKEIDKSETLTNKEVLIDDRIFGNGILKFLVKKDDINKISSVKIY